MNQNACHLRQLALNTQSQLTEKWHGSGFTVFLKDNGLAFHWDWRMTRRGDWQIKYDPAGSYTEQDTKNWNIHHNLQNYVTHKTDKLYQNMTWEQTEFKILSPVHSDPIALIVIPHRLCVLKLRPLNVLVTHLVYRILSYPCEDLPKTNSFPPNPLSILQWFPLLMCLTITLMYISLPVATNEV